MKNGIVNLADFETAVRDKPIESLTRIREITLMPKKSGHHCDSMTEAMLSFLLCEQKENQSAKVLENIIPDGNEPETISRNALVMNGSNTALNKPKHTKMKQ